MIIESLESAEARGARIYAEIKGYSSNCHGAHPLSPEENGFDTYYTLQQTLLQSGIKPHEIDMVNTHASSTIVGDISEARGVRHILNNKHTHDSLEKLAAMKITNLKDEDLDNNLSKASVNALKPYIGHSQLCAGAVESILALKTFETDVIPMNRNLEDPCLDGLNYVMKDHEKKKIDVLAKTCFGFGSQCSSMIFKRFTE